MLIRISELRSLIREVVLAGDFDHDDFFGIWYKSPGQSAGTAGDPYRSTDAKAQLGMTRGGDEEEINNEEEPQESLEKPK